MIQIITYLKLYFGMDQGKLPDVLNDNQKERKIGNLLASLRKNGDIKTDPKDRTSWILNE